MTPNPGEQFQKPKQTQIPKRVNPETEANPSETKLETKSVNLKGRLLTPDPTQ